jgi:hypothetical protein
MGHEASIFNAVRVKYFGALNAHIYDKSSFRKLNTRQTKDMQHLVCISSVNIVSHDALQSHSVITLVFGKYPFIS